MSNDIYNFILSIFSWNNIADFFNSNFTAALAGALAGALVAQRIGDRSKERELLLQEIRSTNTAIMGSFSICNAMLILKKDSINSIYDAYETRKAELKEYNRRRAAGELSSDIPFNIQAEFTRLQMPVVPIDVLRKQIYENISVGKRPLALVAALDGTISFLADMIQQYHDLIELSKNLQGAKFASFYFGFPHGNELSSEFPDTIEALHKQTNDVIFFSELLGKDLMAHGANILVQYGKVNKIKKEKIVSVDFADARAKGLMPDVSAYPDWFKIKP